jgi:diguanylate cyclase (GGDEF)-like protein
VFLPLGFVGLLFLGRGLAAFIWPDEIGVPLERVTATNVALLAAIMTFGLLVHLCVGLAIALRLLGKMRDQSRMDSLTQLPNRRAADEMLQRLLRGARAQDQRATALAIDVDHFKRINDEHGHLAGDRALVHLARLLGQQLRSGDLLARMGGEELLVLLPDTDVAAACELGERLRQVVAQSPLRWGDANVPMTVSIGIAGLRAGERQADDWLARADALLYEAKREGRNRVKAEPQP